MVARGVCIKYVKVVKRYKLPVKSITDVMYSIVINSEVHYT